MANNDPTSSLLLLLLRYVVLIFICSLVGLAVYWCCTDSGLYHWLKEWQLEELHGYYPLFTLMLTFLLTVVVPGGLLLMIAIAMEQNQIDRILQERPQIVCPDKKEDNKKEDGPAL